MTLANVIRSTTLAATLCTSLWAADSITVELVSTPSNPRPSSRGDSGDLELSDDGKWAVFTSSGNGLVTNANNGATLGVFLRNNETGEITLISRPPGSSGNLANGNSYAPRISGDGSFVVFETEANNLVGAGDEDDEGTYAFLFSRLPGVSEGILTGPLGDNVVDVDGAASGAPVLTPDGKFLLFETDAPISNLDTNESVDLYRISPDAQIDLVSTRSNTLQAASVSFPSAVIGTFDASMSADGRYVAFISSGTNHFPGVSPTAAPQVYLRDMVAQTNAWLSRSSTRAAATIVGRPVVSTNGTSVLFIASDLTGSVSPSSQTTFLYHYEIASGTLTEIAPPPPGIVEDFSLAQNGQFVAFSATNQIYLHDLVANTNTLASRTVTGEKGSGVSFDTAISADGRMVVFTSTATNLAGGSTNGLFQTYRFDRDTGEVALLSRSAVAGGDAGGDNDTLFPVMSADGSTVGFMSYASNLTTNDNPLSNDLFFVSPSGTGTVTLASAPHPMSVSATAAGQSFVEAQAISLDGRFVVFSSEAPDVAADDTNSTRDLFLRNLQSGVNTLISRRPDGASHESQSTFISASLDLGVILYSNTEVVSGLSARRLYLYDRSTGSNSIVSILPNGNLAATVSQSLLSPDGRLLVFRELSAASSPLYVRDLATETTTQYIPSPTSIGTEPVAISPAGDFLLTRLQSSTYALHDLTQRRYLSNIASPTLISQPFAANGLLLAATGTVTQANLLLRSLNSTNDDVIISAAGTPLAISLDGSSAAYLERDGTNSYLYFYNTRTGVSTPLMQDGTNVNIRIRPGATFSADGRYFAFLTSDALTPVAHSFNKLYVYDTVLKTVRLAATGIDGPAEFGVGNPAFSANGRVLVYDTFSANLVANDLNLASDVFVSRLSPVDTDTDSLEDGWETIHFGGLTNNGDTDSDSDGISDRDEFRTGTDPNNPSSTLTLEMEVGAAGETITITAPATVGMTYQLQQCVDLATEGWQNTGKPAVALSDTMTFEAALNPGSNGFFRINVVQ